MRLSLKKYHTQTSSNFLNHRELRVHREFGFKSSLCSLRSLW